MFVNLIEKGWNLIKGVYRTAKQHAVALTTAGGTALASVGARADDFVSVDGTTGALTFDPSVIITSVLNAAVSGINAAVPLLILAGSVWVILRMFGIVGKVRR